MALDPYSPPQSDVNLGAGSPESSLRPASRGARLGARLLDGLVEFAPVFTCAAIAGLATMNMPRGNGTAVLIVGIGYLCFFGLWIYQVVRLVRTGQTLGKKWLGIKVVRTELR